ncbi:hypothetical protein [Coleofasciculus sp. H7-2]|uniref:hypothetical protein n=1 Tax=Coleofasciculus sp. H7-2 TaxID=3351545 RepID=UPI00367241D8
MSCYESVTVQSWIGGDRSLCLTQEIAHRIIIALLGICFEVRSLSEYNHCSAWYLLPSKKIQGDRCFFCLVRSLFPKATLTPINVGFRPSTQPTREMRSHSSAMR